MIAIPNMDKPESCAECEWIAWSNLEQSDVCDRCEGRPIEDCEKVADFCPLIDIVRCKDCKHRDPEDKKCDSGMLERQGCIFPVNDDYFCKYAERRADEGIAK